MVKQQGKASITPARRAAFDVLYRVETEGAYASVLVASLPDALSREDRALAHEIVLGVLRWQKALDYFISRYSARAIERLDLAVLIALRIGLYQLRHLTRVPHSAAVNESVKLVKWARLTSASGLVNAVLRRAASNPEDRPGEDLVDPVERSAVELSHPAWLLDRWRKAWGQQDLATLALANNLVPCHALRINTVKVNTDEALSLLRGEGLQVRPSHFVPGALLVHKGEAASLIRLHEQGLIHLQDEASQLISLLLSVKPNQRILDLCAAPGSKTSHIASLTLNKSWILAGDIHPHRIAMVRETCMRVGAVNVDAIAMDATEELPILDEAPRFDRVLIDAPCTGTGTLRRNPEIKWRLRPEQIGQMADLQLRLIERAAGAVDEGGRMVYSTCSLEVDENEAVARTFLETHREFRLARPEAHPDLITSEGFVRTFPHRHGMDGFFAAVFERVSDKRRGR